MLIQDDRPSPASQAPFFKRYPPVLVGLAALIIAVSMVQMLVSPDTENDMMLAAALVDLGQYGPLPRPFGDLAPFVLHVFLHVNLLHLAVNMWAMMSFGALIVFGLGRDARGAIAFLTFFFVCAIGGALAQVALFHVQAEGGSAIGASSAISGLLPALGWLQGRWKRAVIISVPWVLINLGLAVLGEVVNIPIAWAAHLGGVAAGFSFPLFFYWVRRQGSVR